MSSTNKKPTRIQRLMAKYRFTVTDESTFKERVSFKLSRFNVVALIALVLMLVTGLIFSLLVFTPLKNYIPGYADDQLRADAKAARMMADSLMLAQKKNDKYLENVRLILAGEVVPDEIAQAGVDSVAGDETLNYEISETDSALRAKIEEEDRFDFSIEEAAPVNSALKALMFKPVEGNLSAGYDETVKHYGIDVIAPENEVVKSVMDGTVVFSSWTDDGGYVIQVQHSFNMLSVYKHNSTLFKSVGDAVKAGEGIAVIGNSGEETDGPHLHLELWQDGVPVDPQRFFVYEGI